jgi:hypothetical protein
VFLNYPYISSINPDNRECTAVLAILLESPKGLAMKSAYGLRSPSSGLIAAVVTEVRTSEVSAALTALTITVISAAITGGHADITTALRYNCELH